MVKKKNSKNKEEGGGIREKLGKIRKFKPVDFLCKVQPVALPKKFQQIPKTKKEENKGEKNEEKYPTKTNKKKRRKRETPYHPLT